MPVSVDGRNNMAYLTRNRIGLLAALCLLLLIIGSLFTRLTIPDERSIRSAIIQQLTQWTGAAVSISGPMRISYFPRPSVVLPNVQIIGIEGLPALRDISAKRVIVELELWPLFTGTVAIDSITLIEPRIKSISRAPATARRSAAKLSQYLVHALTTMPFEQISIENGQLSAAGPAAGDPFSDINVTINLSRPGGAHSSQGSFTWRGQNISFRYEGGDPKQTANTVKIPVSVTISGQLFSAKIEGEALVTDDLWVKGDLDLQIANLPRFARWTGVLVPGDQTSGDFAATGEFHWQGHKLGFNEASFVLDGNRALGAMILDFGGPRPQIEGTFALQKLDLTHYIQTSAAQSATSAPDKRKSASLNFPLLHHLDLDVRISTTELIAPPLALGQSALSVTLKSGRLAADIAVFEMCGGSGGARLEFDASAPVSTLRVTANLTEVSAQRCIEIFTPDSPLEGTANVTAEVAGKGRTVKDILDTLEGEITLSMTAGKADVDVPGLVTSLRKGPVNGWSAVRGSATAFVSLNGEFSLRHGSATLDSLKIDLGTTELTGNGTIDLAAGGLDMRMRIIAHPPKDASADTNANEPDDSLPGDIVIKGPWSEPLFTLEPGKKSARMVSPD